MITALALVTYGTPTKNIHHRCTCRAFWPNYMTPQNCRKVSHKKKQWQKGVYDHCGKTLPLAEEGNYESRESRKDSHL